MDFAVNATIFSIETVVKGLEWAYDLGQVLNKENETCVEKKVECDGATDAVEKGLECKENDDQTSLKPDVDSQDKEGKDEKRKDEKPKNEIVAMEDDQVNHNPVVVVTEDIPEIEGDSGKIQDMFSKVNLSPNTQLHEMAKDKISSLNKKLKIYKEKEDEEANLLTPNKPLEGQCATPNSKPLNEDEENSLYKKMPKNEIVAMEDEQVNPNPEVVVTEDIPEIECDSGKIQGVFSKVNLSPNTQLHEMAKDKSSSLNKKLKMHKEKEDEEANLFTPNKPLEGQCATPNSKALNEDEENSLYKKMKHQREKIEGDKSNLLEFWSQQSQDVTPDNKKPSTGQEESTLLKKLKQQREKLDTIDSADRGDRPNQIDLRINTFKLAATVAVEDALAEKLKQRLKKIDDNVMVEEVTTKHESKSLVEDALGEKLKKQQQKIDGFYEVVIEAVSQRPAESLVEDALAEILKKRRNKIDEGREGYDVALDIPTGGKYSINSWETGGTLDRKLRKQRQKMKDAAMTLEPKGGQKSDCEAQQANVNGSEMNLKETTNLSTVSVGEDADVKRKDVNWEKLVSFSEPDQKRMTSLVRPATRMDRTRE